MGILRSPCALPWCPGVLCAMAHIHLLHTGVCCPRYVASRQPTPREGAGQLPAFLLDQGQQPGTPPLPASKRAEQSPYNTAQEASSKGGGRSKGLAQDLSTPRNHGGGVVAAVSSPPSQREKGESREGKMDVDGYPSRPGGGDDGLGWHGLGRS